MEFCDAGTLEEIGFLGLPMIHIQDYTSQLLLAVSILHKQGVIHRDIKGLYFYSSNIHKRSDLITGSNIFLTSGGLLKLGDFGSAIKLMNKNSTMPGEICSHSGITAAYTAPEVGRKKKK